MKKFHFKSSWMNLKSVTKAFFLFHNSNTLIFTHSEPPFIKTLHTFNSLKALRWLKESSVTEKCHFSSFENVWSKLVPVSKTIALQVGRFLTLVVFFVLAGEPRDWKGSATFPEAQKVCWSTMLSNIFIYFLSHLTDTVSSLFTLFRAGIADFTCRNQVSSRTQGLWLQPFLHLFVYRVHKGVLLSKGAINPEGYMPVLPSYTLKETCPFLPWSKPVVILADILLMPLLALVH